MDTGKRHAVNMAELICLEEELAELKKRDGSFQEKWWMKTGDLLAAYMGKKKLVSRKVYMKKALTCGWFCGAHRFYSGHRISGVFYLLFFWTGIPFAMTLIDLMIVLPMETDENGEIEV